MSKSLKILPSVLALISIGFSVSILFGWSPFLKFFKKGETLQQVVPEQALIFSEELPSGVSFVLPVEEKYLESALKDEENPQGLSFFLEPNTPIRAIFPGRIIRLERDVLFGDDIFDLFILESEDHKLQTTYLVYGSAQINIFDEVKEGDVLATAKEGGLSFKEGANFSIFLYKNIPLSKDLFK